MYFLFLTFFYLNYMHKLQAVFTQLTAEFRFKNRLKSSNDDYTRRTKGNAPIINLTV